MAKLDLSKFTKKITGPFTRQEFEICRLRLRDYMREMGALPVDTVGSVSKQLETFSENLKASAGSDGELEEKSTRFFLSQGVRSPKIFFGDEDKCPEGQLPVALLGSDLDFLRQQLLDTWDILDFGQSQLARSMPSRKMQLKN